MIFFLYFSLLINPLYRGTIENAFQISEAVSMATCSYRIEQNVLLGVILTESQGKNVVSIVNGRCDIGVSQIRADCTQAKKYKNIKINVFHGAAILEKSKKPVLKINIGHHVNAVNMLSITQTLKHGAIG